MKRLAVAVMATAEAMGTELSPEAAKMFSIDLAYLPEGDVYHGLQRCRREVKGSNGFPPRLILQDVLERAGVITTEDEKRMEASAAWDLVMLLASKFVHVNGQSDTKGDPICVLRRTVSKPLADCQKCHGDGTYFVAAFPDSGNVTVARCDCRTVEELPPVPERVSVVVRSMGGWVTFKDIPAKSFPFVKRDFLLEYGRQEKAEKYQMLQLPEAKPVLALGVEKAENNPHRLDGMLARIVAAP